MIRKYTATDLSFSVFMLVASLAAWIYDLSNESSILIISGTWLLRAYSMLPLFNTCFVLFGPGKREIEEEFNKLYKLERRKKQQYRVGEERRRFPHRYKN